MEKRAERRLVVLTLIASLRAEALPIRGLIVAADEIARDQWLQLLVRDGQAVEGWTVQTAVDMIADGGGGGTGCVVVVDELESYVTEDFAAALRGSRALLGLRSSPGGLGEAQRFRKYIGRALTPQNSIGHIDFHPLLEGPSNDSEADKNDLEEPREQVLSTNNLENLLGTYLSKIQKVTLLTAEEEIDLGKRIEAGLYATQKLAALAARGEKLPVQQRREMQWICRDGERAKNHFIEANLRLVYQIARKYSRRMDIMDVIQEGNLGLIHAVEKFDYTKGFKFSTYATWWIRQAITRAIADKGSLIRIPVHMVESDNAVLAERRKRLQEGASTRSSEIAAELGIAVEDVEAAVNRHRRPYSLELMTEEGFDLLDEDAADIHELAVGTQSNEQVQKLLECLSEREAGIVRLRMGFVDGECRTLDEIGQVYGVTRERIRQIESKAFSKISHPARSYVLIDFLS